MVIAATGVVDAEPAAVFAFLSDLRNHWQLTGRWVRVLHLVGPGSDPTGGWVELRGPLGIRRRLRTTVIDSSEHRRIDGVAELAPNTRARVSWLLEPDAAARTQVRLEATLLSSGCLDRALLLIGARRWLRARFQATLAQLALLLARQSAEQRSQLVVEPLGAGVLQDPLPLTRR